MNLSNRTILLVEDEMLIALSEKKKLEQAGYKVIHALTGESAIEIVNENPAAIDLILMDINLGSGMDGTGAAQIILRTHNIPIVFLSSHTEPEIVRKTEEITSFGYVVKSSSFTVLDASIKMAFKLFQVMRQLDLNDLELETTNDSLRKKLAELQGTHSALALHETIRDKFFNLSPLAVSISRLSDGVFNEVNQRFCGLFGFTREEAIGHSFFSEDMGIWINQKEWKELVEKARKFDGPMLFEMDYRRKDGTVFQTLTHAVIMSINEEEYVLSIIKDKAEGNHSDAELIESEDRYRLLFEEAGAGILICDRDLKILDTNKRSVQMFDYTKDELSTKTLFDLDPDLADPMTLKERVEGIVESGPYTFTGKRQQKDGKVLPVEVTAMAIVWHGKPAIMAVVHDLTEQMKMEQEYEKAHAILKSALEGPNEVLMVGIDKEFKVLYVNKAYHDLKEKMFGVDIKIGDSLLENLPIDRIFERSIAYYRTALSGKAVRIIEDYDSSELAFESIFNPIHGEDGKIIGVSAFSLDISERVAFEKQLREREAQLKTIGDNVPAHMALVGAADLRYRYVNKLFAKNYGRTIDQIIGKRVNEIIGDEFFDRALNHIKEVCKGKELSYENLFHVAQGDVWGRMTYVPQLGSDGKVDSFLVLGIDITDLKNASEALKKSEERFRLAMDAADEGIWDYDLAAGKTYYSPAYFNIIGHDVEEAGQPIQFEKYVHPDDSERIAKARKDCIENLNDSFEIDYRLRSKDGTWKWINARGRVLERDGDGKVTRIIGTSRDISDRKLDEERIAAITKELQTILDTAPVGIAKIVDRKFVWGNKAIPKLLKYSVDELRHKDASLLFPSTEAWFSASKSMYDIFSDGENLFRMTQALVRGDGQLATIQLSGKAIDASDISKGIILAGEDISKQKKLEDQLIASEAKYRALFKAVSDAMCIIDRESGTILDCNEATVAIFGYTKNELIGTAFTSTLVEPQGTTTDEIATTHRIPLHYHRTKDGVVIPVEITNSLLNIDGKDVIVAAMRDISSRLESEQAIRKLLNEKELILLEVHHRIKNNLQVLSSILSIRVANSGDEKANSFLNEAISEIESISLLYDKLYRSAYTGIIPVNMYLPELLLQAVQVFGEEIQIKIETEIEDISLEAGLLSRLGIVINELVTNSIKYAFSEINDPVIRLRVSKHDSYVHITYEDNGNGLSSSFAMDSCNGFGMQLIQGMLHQIGGTIVAETNNGARFTIGFEA